MPPIETPDEEIRRLQSRVTTLQELLEVHEQTVIEQSVRLEHAMAELRAAKQAAEQASAAKTTFLTTMSHELRTPLNAVLGFSDMMRDEAREEGDEALAADLDKIHAAGSQLLELINGVLDLSRIEAGRMELFLESFDLASLVDEVCTTMQPLAARNENSLVASGHQAAGYMHADRIKLRQVLLNLVANACKFTTGGTVGISVSRAVDEQGPRIRIRIEDTGIGMTSEVRERLFQPFTQADGSTTRRYGGTGLGLAISRRFCQLMKGDISVDSEPGRGSVFTLDLPATVQRAPSARAEPPAEMEVARGDPSARDVVLAIDDDPAMLEMLVRGLGKRGYHVVTASGGIQGLALARTVRPMAITLDVLMPDLDGWSVLSACRADPRLAQVPIFLISVVGERSLGVALGASSLLTKPVNFDALAHLLEPYRSHVRGPVMVVEDDATTREVLVRRLEAGGWPVATANNGAEALAKLPEVQPRLILLDLMMPEMDGMEFLARLRADPRWRTVPVVVLTAKDLDAEDWRRLTGNVERVLQKGHAFGLEILDELCEMLEGYRQGPEPETIL